MIFFENMNPFVDLPKCIVRIPAHRRRSCQSIIQSQSKTSNEGLDLSSYANFRKIIFVGGKTDRLKGRTQGKVYHVWSTMCTVRPINEKTFSHWR